MLISNVIAALALVVIVGSVGAVGWLRTLGQW
jgi:hypothetical protein